MCVISDTTIARPLQPEHCRASTMASTVLFSFKFFDPSNCSCTAAISPSTPSCCSVHRNVHRYATTTLLRSHNAAPQPPRCSAATTLLSHNAAPQPQYLIRRQHEPFDDESILLQAIAATATTQAIAATAQRKPSCCYYFASHRATATKENQP